MPASPTHTRPPAPGPYLTPTPPPAHTRYISCVVGCPIQGQVDPRAVADVARALHDMGCYEVSVGDTIGVGTPASVSRMFEECIKVGNGRGPRGLAQGTAHE